MMSFCGPICLEAMSNNRDGVRPTIATSFSWWRRCPSPAHSLAGFSRLSSPGHDMAVGVSGGSAPPVRSSSRTEREMKLRRVQTQRCSSSSRVHFLFSVRCLSQNRASETSLSIWKLAAPAPKTRTEKRKCIVWVPMEVHLPRMKLATPYDGREDRLKPADTGLVGDAYHQLKLEANRGQNS